MSSANNPLQGFGSTPAFELFRRGLIVQTVKRFRGLNAYVPLTQITPDVASDLLNVIVGSSGLLSKMRLPVALSSIVGGNQTGPYSFWDFQQGIGTRQVVAHFGQQLQYFTNDLANGTLIDANILNASPWSFIEANNILFGANGQRMQKWTGTAWQQWGINAPTVAPILSAVTLPVINVSSIVQYGQTSAKVYINPVIFPAPGQSITIAGNSFAGYNATWTVITQNATGMDSGGSFFWFGFTTAQANTGLGGTVTYALGLLTGWGYAYAYKNSVTGHVSNISPTAFAGIPASGKINQVTATTPTDSQVDTIIWFRTLDGSGDYFRLAEININTGAFAFNAGGVTLVGGSGNLAITDQSGDGSLDLTTRGPVINNPPPQGTYTALAQGRIFVAGLSNAGSDVVYSGYEQILTGRPEESFPPNNRLRLALGAESVVGLGALHSGMVMFSNTGKMWMLRGAVEDITLSAPVAFSEFLEELPWTLGCLSHYTIKETPFGLVWLAGDKTVQFWDGRSNPNDISKPVYPILRSITPGTERSCSAAYFNWLERDWYALTCCTNGAGAPNTIIFWALDADTSEIDIFVSNIQADWIGGFTSSKLQRKLLISHGGIISEIPIRATDQGGLTNDFKTYPPTSGNLRAYWRSGYFGNESSEQSKLWRWTRVVTDSGPTDYQLQARFVNAQNLINNPRLVGPITLGGDRTPMNQRAARASIEIDFPEKDESCNVLEMQVAYIGTSQR